MDPSVAMACETTRRGESDLSLAKADFQLLKVSLRCRTTTVSEDGAPRTPYISTPVARRSAALSNADDQESCADFLQAKSEQVACALVTIMDKVRFVLLWLDAAQARTIRIAGIKLWTARVPMGDLGFHSVCGDFVV
jgi:hypothetical protein